MNVLGNSELSNYLYVCLGITIFVCMLGLIFKRFGPEMQKRLDIKIKKWSNQLDKKRELLEVEYRTCSTDELLEELKKILTKKMVHNAAIFNVSRSRMDDDRIRHRIQQLQSSIDIKTRRNADFVMRDYYEKQYTDSTVEELLDLLRDLEDRNQQESEALLAIAINRIEDHRLRQYLHQLLSSIDRGIKFNAELMIREYFEKQNATDTTEDLLDLLHTLENRDKQEIAVTLTIAAGRMQDQRVNLCIEQLQNSNNRLVREQAKQIIKDYMA